MAAICTESRWLKRKPAQSHEPAGPGQVKVCSKDDLSPRPCPRLVPGSSVFGPGLWDLFPSTARPPQRRIIWSKMPTIPKTLLRHSSTNPPSLCSPKAPLFSTKDGEAVSVQEGQESSVASITASCPCLSRLLEAKASVSSLYPWNMVHSEVSGTDVQREKGEPDSGQKTLLH